MIHYEHNFNVICYKSRSNTYMLCTINVEAQIINPNSLKNCVLDYSGMKSTYDVEYDSVEEAQMNASIQGFDTISNEYIPVISFESLNKFKKVVHLFPISMSNAKIQLMQRIVELDMFKMY